MGVAVAAEARRRGATGDAARGEPRRAGAGRRRGRRGADGRRPRARGDRNRVRRSRRRRDGGSGRRLPPGRADRGKACEGPTSSGSSSSSRPRTCSPLLGEQERNGQVLVGFGAEAGEAGLERKRRMLTDKNLDLVVYNDVTVPGIGFDAPDNEVTLRHEGRRAAAAAGVEGRDRRRDRRRGRAPAGGAPWRRVGIPAAVADVGGDASSGSSRTSRASCTRPPTRFGSASSASLAEGHVIIEDFPGVGKTMLAKSLARSLDVDFSRIQFTPDLLPSDVTGVNVFNQRDERVRVPARARSSRTSCSSTRSTAPRRRRRRRCSRRCRRTR